jgi:thiazole synthase ThiGH ThiG subunit
MQMADDPLIIAGREFGSRLILGTCGQSGRSGTGVARRAD